MGQHCPSLVWVLCRTGQKGQFHIFLFSFLFSKALEKRCPECPTVVSQRFSRIRKKSVDVYCFLNPLQHFTMETPKKKSIPHQTKACYIIVWKHGIFHSPAYCCFNSVRAFDVDNTPGVQMNLPATLWKWKLLGSLDEFSDAHTHKINFLCTLDFFKLLTNNLKLL